MTSRQREHTVYIQLLYIIMKTQTFNIALPENLVKTIDRAAKREYRNRSELIREALRMYLKNTQEWEELFTIGAQQAEQTGIINEQGVAKVVTDYRHKK